MMLTCVAILAVDFEAFPRSSAKTEEFGFSLMDLGAGSAVFSSGLVSRYAMAKPLGPFRRTAQQALPMLALWLGRLVTVKAVDYQEHVSEYGVHWNLFATMACVWLLVGAARSCLPRRVPLLPALLLGLAAYQAVLVRVPGATEWMLGADRRAGLVAANREGLCGVLGHAALYAAGEAAGAGLVWPAATAGRASAALQSLAWAAAAAWACCGALHAWVQPCSRRLTNAAFCAWVVGNNLSLLAAVLAGDAYADRLRNDVNSSARYALPCVKAVSANQFGCFLVGNLLTGAVNLSVNTMQVGTAGAVATLSVYTLFLVGLALEAGKVTGAGSGLYSRMTGRGR